MTELEPRLAALWFQMLGQGGIVFLRVAAAVALLPGFGETVIPVRVRLGLAVALTLVVAPVVALVPDGGGGIARFPVYLATETLAGLSLGIVLRLLVQALQTAGTIAAQSASLAQLFAGAGAEPMPALSHLMVSSALALAMMWGLAGQAARALILTYEVWPAGDVPSAALMREWGVAVVGQSFALAFTLAMPFLIAGLLYNLALGAINRARPGLMVAMIGAPAMALGMLVLAALTLPSGLLLWAGALGGALGDPFGGP